MSAKFFNTSWYSRNRYYLKVVKPYTIGGTGSFQNDPATLDEITETLTGMGYPKQYWRGRFRNRTQHMPGADAQEKDGACQLTVLTPEPPDSAPCF
jgi:hypothetical protein